MSVLKCSASPLCSQMPFTVGWWGYLLIPSCQQAQKGAALLPAHVLLHTPTCHALPRIESLYLSLLLTWAKHAPVFWRPLWNCHVLRHLCCGSNYTSRVGRYFTTYKKCQQFVWWLAGELQRRRDWRSVSVPFSCPDTDSLSSCIISCSGQQVNFFNRCDIT